MAIEAVLGIEDSGLRKHTGVIADYASQISTEMGDKETVGSVEDARCAKATRDDFAAKPIFGVIFAMIVRSNTRVNHRSQKSVHV